MGVILGLCTSRGGVGRHDCGWWLHPAQHAVARHGQEVVRRARLLSAPLLGSLQLRTSGRALSVWGASALVVVSQVKALDEPAWQVTRFAHSRSRREESASATSGGSRRALGSA